MEQIPDQQPAPDSNAPQPKRRTLTTVLISIAAVLVVAACGTGVFVYLHHKKSANTNNSQQPALAVPATIADFAQYKEPAVSFTPQIPAYTTDANLSNVTNLPQFNLSDAEKQQLATNLFTVQSGGVGDEFFKTYEQNRYLYTPNLVTADSVLHSYHIVFDYLLRDTEEQKLLPQAKTLTSNMLAVSEQQYEQLKGTPYENAAKRNVGYFSVAAKLLDPNATIPQTAASETSQELALISAHVGPANAVVMNIGIPQGTTPLMEDYSQYIPRGHYTKTPELSQYFQAMMWYGRLTFRFSDPDEVRSALLMTIATDSGSNSTAWDAIYTPTSFFVGVSDDTTYPQMQKLVQGVYGDEASENNLAQIATDASKFDALNTQAAALQPPQINSVPIFNATIQPDKSAAITGFRFMGQRFTPDADIFQNLIYRNVLANSSGEDRMLPKGLDVPAAMGSTQALSILTSEGDTAYQNYPENMSKLQSFFSSLGTNTWTQNMYWGWLYSLQPVIQPATAGYPSFMTNDAWSNEQLQKYLGSYTELKHDTILYSKQSYAELGGGGDIPVYDDRGYVEPYPELYARIAALTQMTNDGLSSRNLVSAQASDALTNLNTLANSLLSISEKELNNQALSDSDYDLIRAYGGQLEHIWDDINQKDMDAADETQSDYLHDNPAAIVADIATDPNGSVLEDATGTPEAIYAIVPVDGKLKIAEGVVYSYYEFAQPISNRLTDKAWQDIVHGESTAPMPSVPEWTKIFTATPPQQ